MKWIYRKNNEPELDVNVDGTLLSSKLEDDYYYIYQSMIENEYEIRFEPYTLLFELIDNEKVVGFATFIVTGPSTYSLTEFFVMPDFESDNLLSDCFLTLLGAGGVISIIEPTRDAVEFLINEGYATKLTDSLVTSAITFDMLGEDILGDYSMDGIVPSSNLYDLNLCSPIFLRDISTPGVCEIMYLKSLSVDDKKYHCNEFRKNTNIDEYFQDIKEVFLENYEEFNQTLFDLKLNLPKSALDYREIVGDGDELSDYFREMVDSGMVGEKRAVEIRNQLIDEYDKGIVKDDGLALRVTYLLDDSAKPDFEVFEDISENFDNFCPYCHTHVSLSEPFCHTCGVNFSNIGISTLKDIKK